MARFQNHKSGIILNIGHAYIYFFDFVQHEFTGESQNLNLREQCNSVFMCVGACVHT